MTDMRHIMNLISEATLDEMAGAGPARIVHHIKEGTPFIMISAMRADLSPSDNKRRTELLRQKLANLPVSYIVTGGEFHELGQELPSEEVSFFIMPDEGVAIDALKRLGDGLMRAFDQDAFLCGDGDSVIYLGKDGEEFSIGDAASFDLANLRDAPGFSKIKGRKFTFTNKQEKTGSVAYGKRSA